MGPNKEMSSTINTLLEIMDDPNLFTRRRVEAAEAILGFEAPEGAVVRARDFLVSVFEDRDAEIGDRMEALKLSRKAEAPKVASKIIRLEVKGRTEADRREAWRRYEMSRLKMKIVRATGTTPLAESGWADAFGDDYLPPEGDEWPDWSKRS
jgi:hypothetical protein